MKREQVIDTEKIIINLLEEDKKNYTSITRLQKLICYIYDALLSNNILKKYQIYCDINFNAIRRTVLYQNRLFELSIDGDIIYLRKSEKRKDLAKKYSLDKEIINIIHDFKQQYN